MRLYVDGQLIASHWAGLPICCPMKGSQQLSLSPGDHEVVLEFTVPESPLPDGWTRDFVLHNVGWDKDADLHTVYGQTVEPLPLQGMSQSPPLPDERRLDDPEYQQYLEQYQTRTTPVRPDGRR